MTPELVLTGARVLLTTSLQQEGARGCLSIAITAKALVTIDLLLANCADIDLAEITGVGQRPYEMAVRPIRVDSLSGAPALTIRALGITTPVALTPVLQLTLTDPRSDPPFTTSHAVGELSLSAAAPVYTTDLPSTLFTHDPSP